MDSFQHFYDRFSYRLSGLATVEVSPPDWNGTISLHVIESMKTFIFDRDCSEVFKGVEGVAEEGLWPEMDPMEAKLSLFSVHVEEAIDLAPEGSFVLTWGPQGLEAVRGGTPSAAG
ncbi:MAG: hypothetical protein ABWX63_04860 [Paeniglutamicibacter terrestris]